MKNLFVVLTVLMLLVLGFGTISAQSENQDKVILKGGSVLYGQLVEYKEDGSIKLIVNEREMTISGKKVKRVLMHDNSIGISRINSHNWYFRSNFGLLVNGNGTGLSLNQTVSYALSQWLMVGVGFGFDNYYARSGRNIFPVYTELKTYLFERQSTPFIAFRSGYGFNFASEKLNQITTEGGIILNPMVGFQFGGNHTSWDLYVGYKTQNSRYVYRQRNALVDQAIRWHRIEVGVGLNF